MILQIVLTELVPMMEQLVPGTAGINTMAAVSQDLSWPLCHTTCARRASWPWRLLLSWICVPICQLR